MPDTVEDDGEGSDGTPSDDVESAPPIDNKSGAVKFGWIRGVLVSYVGSRRLPLLCSKEGRANVTVTRQEEVDNAAGRSGAFKSGSDLHLLKCC